MPNKYSETELALNSSLVLSLELFFKGGLEGSFFMFILPKPNPITIQFLLDRVDFGNEGAVVSYADQGIINFYDVLHSSWSFQEYNMEALSITNQYKGHYKNRLYLDGDWEYFNASQVGPLSGQFFTLLKSMNLLTNIFYEKWSTLKWEACSLHEKLIHCKPS